MKRLLTLRFFPLLSLLLFFVAVMHAGLTEAKTLQIRDDPTGGDCASFAAWNAKTKTCTLTDDLEGDAIEVLSNGITLDGNGYAIIGTTTEGGYADGAAVSLKGVRKVNVTRLIVQYFDEGILLDGVRNATVAHNTLIDNGEGIDLDDVTDSAVTHNTLVSNYESIELESSHRNEIIGNVSYLSEFGIDLQDSGHNMIIGNIDVGGFGQGIYLNQSNKNRIVGNEVDQKGETGIRINNSHSNMVAGNSISNSKLGIFINPYSEKNRVINNNFVDNAQQAGYQPSVEGVRTTFRGNHWSDYDSPEEGCYDGNGDGICDDPYLIFASEMLLVEDASAKVEDTTVAAKTEVVPDVLTTESGGEPVTVYIEVPGYAPGDIRIESVRMGLATDDGDGYVWANESPTVVGDYNANGVPDLMVKFDRDMVKMILIPGLNEGTVVGALAENTFKGIVFITLE